MPRRPRLFVPGAIYHVYCRVARGEFVFDEHDEAVEFVVQAEQLGTGHAVDQARAALAGFGGDVAAMPPT